MKKLYNEFSQKSFNVNIINEIIINANQNVTQSITLKSSDEDWKYIVIFLRIIKKYKGSLGWLEQPVDMDWSTKSVGSFFMKNMRNFKENCANENKEQPPPWEQLKALHQLFSLPHQNLSLMQMASIYTANDFRVLIKDRFEHNFSILLGKCLKNVESAKFDQDHEEFFIDEKINSLIYLEPSPCLNISKFPKCIDYCIWHNSFFKTWPKDEFITLMKYALPQRKVSLNQNFSLEQNIATKLFGNKATKNLKYSMAPSPLILFCYTKDEGFTGDDLGIFANACNEFFPTPCDQGICLTKGMDIKRVMQKIEGYGSLFEEELQKMNENLVDGTSGSKSTLVFLTGVGRNVWGGYDGLDENDGRIPNEERFNDVQLNLHQSNEIASLLEDRAFRESSTSLTLKAGYEYYIDIHPEAEISTEAFKKLSFQQRKCRLEGEVSEDSIFKIYTKKNCKYECHVKLAMKLCNCIPWDFIHNIKAAECDIFGRTCFYNAMENISMSNYNHCNHCIDACDEIHYNGIIKKERLANKPIGQTVGTDRQALLYSISSWDGICTAGQRIFCDFFAPNTTNGTIIDNGLKNSFNSMTSSPTMKYNKIRSNMVNDMVIVHLKILKPKLDVIDVKYTLVDKFAKFGGNFGIFAQITGCSFLVLLNVLILMFKLPFTSDDQ